jgi:hypothetical protein
MECPFCRQSVESIDGHCPECRMALGAAPANQLEPTRLQPVMVSDAIGMTWQRETVLQPRKPHDQSAPVAFRPRLRPPMLVLCVWDDGGEHGNWIRVYGDRFVIGRAEGDLIIPHEVGMSKRHAELIREPSHGRWIWRLRDLESRNGTFVRINVSLLHHGQMLLMGSGRYRFQGVAQGGRLTDSEPPAHHQETQVWPTLDPEDVTPMLVRLTAEGEAGRMLIHGKEQWVGTEEKCGLHVPGDPLLDARHARIYSTGRDQWSIADHNSANGTWSMVQDIVIEDTLQFQIGEQRFLARIP